MQQRAQQTRQRRESKAHTKTGAGGQRGSEHREQKCKRQRQAGSGRAAFCDIPLSHSTAHSCGVRQSGSIGYDRNAWTCNYTNQRSV